ncbi:hypothetical protein SODALDRAFT_358979 [Sodiomyces alkalinus F11]|uniref:Uncharacterized protein n=1 Tax=Sodiomyces alkalinus (strain CBS 110278 / VKM F-3762 / F11) TaxID=1314773 RepID=A0A3N2PX55_SODAK|nr:hypothetical protein SODALDRAFT_358979 [Sodiomyces alkalinus F11]ROT39113.1 hypothetical protein SODALDRAFT_358979 [Sodiomyces alkalinus F11]
MKRTAKRCSGGTLYSIDKYVPIGRPLVCTWGGANQFRDPAVNSTQHLPISQGTIALPILRFLMNEEEQDEDGFAEPLQAQQRASSYTVETPPDRRLISGGTLLGKTDTLLAGCLALTKLPSQKPLPHSRLTIPPFCLTLLTLTHSACPRISSTSLYLTIEPLSQPEFTLGNQLPQRRKPASGLDVFTTFKTSPPPSQTH